MKIKTFSTSAQFEAIKAFVPKAETAGRILDFAHEVDGKIFFSRVVNGRLFLTSSIEEFGLTVFHQRTSELGVYLSSSATSSFRGQLADAVQLLEDGYKVYRVKEHIHTDISIKLASNKPIRTAQEILRGPFRDGYTKHRRFASTYSFLAQPKSWSAPTGQFLQEFSNWINGYIFTYELLCATPGGFTENGETKFSIEIFDDCSGYCSSESAERSGLDALEAAVSKRGIVMI